MSDIEKKYVVNWVKTDKEQYFLDVSSKTKKGKCKAKSPLPKSLYHSC